MKVRGWARGSLKMKSKVGITLLGLMLFVNSYNYSFAISTNQDTDPVQEKSVKEQPRNIKIVELPLIELPGDKALSDEDCALAGKIVFQMDYSKGVEYFKQQFLNLKKIRELSGDDLKVAKVIVLKRPKQDYEGSVVIVGLADQVESGVEIRNTD